MKNKLKTLLLGFLVALFGAMILTLMLPIFGFADSDYEEQVNLFIEENNVIESKAVENVYNMCKSQKIACAERLTNAAKGSKEYPAETILRCAKKAVWDCDQKKNEYNDGLKRLRGAVFQ